MCSIEKMNIVFAEMFKLVDRLTGFWHSYNCGFAHGSICKRSGSPPRAATVAPAVPPEGGCPPKWKKMGSKVRSPLNFDIDQQDDNYGPI